MNKPKSEPRNTVNVDTFRRSGKENNDEKKGNLENEMESSNHQTSEEVQNSKADMTEAGLREKDREIEALAAELADTKERLLRKAAEFENMRKRMARERVQLFEDARIEALREFLPVNDDLQRVLEASHKEELNENFLKGVEMVADKFAGVFRKYGVEPIDEANIPFDVNLHDAMIKQPPPREDMESNTVLQILEPGYKVNDRVIRHAKVIVSE